MLLASAVLILTVALTTSIDAATTYNLALLQETLEVLGEDIVMFITNKLNGGGNTADDDESLYDTADEQPDGIDDAEDDEEEDNSSEDGENATSRPGAEGNQDGRKKAEKDQDGIEAGTKRKPKFEEKKKYVTEIKKSKEPSTKTLEDTYANKVKGHLNETDDEDASGKSTEETGGNEEEEEEEEEEPDMAEALASVAVNVAAQKFKEHLGKLNIQLK